MADETDTEGSHPTPPDPFVRPFITAAGGILQVFHRREDEVIAQDWGADLHRSGHCTDAKAVDGNRHIAALIGDFAGLVSYPSGEVAFQTPPCTMGEHGVELIPGPHLVLACSSEGQKTGLRVFDARKGDTGKDPVQEIDLPSAHALRWDEEMQSLWAIGTNVFPLVHDNPPLDAVHGLLARYPYTGNVVKPLGDPVIYRLRDSPKVPGYGAKDWRDGPHDLAPIPRSRRFLISTDLDVFEFDIDKADPKKAPEENFTPASKGILAGFRPRRPGDGLSNIKALSLSESNNILIAQADKGYFSTHLVSYSPGSRIRSDLQLPHETYKARWREETVGWPAARYSMDH
ncbi:hypothetical protein ACWEKM_08945 [Streptomyces sp. NPDC004752]